MGSPGSRRLLNEQRDGGKDHPFKTLVRVCHALITQLYKDTGNQNRADLRAPSCSATPARTSDGDDLFSSGYYLFLRAGRQPETGEQPGQRREQQY